MQDETYAAATTVALVPAAEPEATPFWAAWASDDRVPVIPDRVNLAVKAWRGVVEPAVGVTWVNRMKLSVDAIQLQFPAVGGKWGRTRSRRWVRRSRGSSRPVD